MRFFRIRKDRKGPRPLGVAGALHLPCRSDQMQKDLNDLEARDRIKLLIDLAGFVIPKLKSIEMTADIQNDNNELIERLLAIPEDKFNKLYNDN